MIVVDKLSLSFGERTLFDKISFNVDRKSRIGLVGRNGSGKSTLLKILAGKQSFDSGEVRKERATTIGYMPQQVVLQSNKNIYEEAFSTFEKINRLLTESEKLESELNKNPEAVERYAHLAEELSLLDVAAAKRNTEQILVGLGFPRDRFDEPVSSLSVGWKMRVVLAKLLLLNADFYFFDEPTNHLDLGTKEWFLEFLQSASFGFMLVCHDRYFLDHLCDKTLELECGRATLYHANYTLYTEQKVERKSALEKAAERQQKEMARMRRTAERFKAKASKAKMAQSILKKLKKTEVIRTEGDQKVVAFSFPPIERSGKVVLTVDRVAHRFGNKKIFENVSFDVNRGERVGIVAPNGVGKTTLFNLIAGKLDLQDGDIKFGYNVSHALFEQDQDKVLHLENTILNEVESSCKDSEARSLVRKFLGAFLFAGDDADKKIKVLSGGEKNRVAMIKVLLTRANLLLLDEPTNHLDIQSKEVLLSALKQFEGTIIFVSHDRDFLERLADRILELSAPSRCSASSRCSTDGVVSYPGDYEAYLYAKKQSRTEQSRTEQSQPDTGVDKAIVRQKKKDLPSNKKKYEAKKQVGRLEAKIAKLEKNIDRLNSELTKHEYGDEKYDEIYKKLLKSEQDRAKTLREWEELSESIQ